jgi:hypothetical protein
MFFRIIEKLKLHQENLFLVTAIVLVSLIGFGLGRLSAKYQTAELNINSTLINATDLNKIVTSAPTNKKTATGSSNQITSLEDQNGGEEIVTPDISNLKIIGNKQSKIFHLENCPGALKMKAENKVFFASMLAAQQAGFKPAGNCPGLVQ